MSVPVPFVPAKRRIHRRRKSVVSPPGLTLVSAVYTPDGVSGFVVLTFDRAIDISGFDGSAIEVLDGEFTIMRFNGTGGEPELVAPAAVKVLLMDQELWHEPGVKLNATGATGIVAAEDAAAWAGVVDVALPFP